jgi:hypothetical protein
MTNPFDIAEQQILDKKKQADFDMRELSIELLVHKFKNHNIYALDDRKTLVWTTEKQTKFIESVIWGIPIAPIFVVDVAKQGDKGGKLEIIDGVQRIQTLVSFLNNQLILNDLELLTELNGKYYSDIAAARRRRLLDTNLKMIVFSKKTPLEIRAEIFHRVNMIRSI